MVTVTDQSPSSAFSFLIISLAQWKTAQNGKQLEHNLTSHSPHVWKGISTSYSGLSFCIYKMRMIYFPRVVGGLNENISETLTLPSPCMCVIGQSYLTLCDPMDCSCPDSFLRPWSPPGKNTGVACHPLLQGPGPHLAIHISHYHHFKD